jgi:hypothetical protein
MSLISHQKGLQRFISLAERFTETGTFEGVRQGYGKGTEADQMLSGQMDRFQRMDNSEADKDKSSGVVQSVDRSGPLHEFIDARFVGDSEEGQLSVMRGLAPGVPDSIALTTFKPDGITQFQIQFAPQDGYQTANVKGVQLDRENPEDSFQETTSWNVAYPQGL